MPNAFDLTVRGTADGIEEGLLALYTPPDTTQKEQVLGKLNVATYDEIQKTVVIVPVNGNKYPYSEANLLTQLNKIYGQAVVKWNVQVAPDGFVVPGIDPFDDGGSGLLSNYSPDMRKVVDAYNTDPAPDTYYLFLVKNPKAGKLAGYMPRSKEFGFIFTDQAGSEQAIIHTIAHELGHGAFNLRHTFAEEKYTIPQGSTDNLMDYTQAFGTKLYKHQWDQMRFPEMLIGVFEKDEAGAMEATGSERFPDAVVPCTTEEITKLQLDFEARLAVKKFRIYGGGMEMYGFDGYKLETGHKEILAKAGICDLAQFDAKFKFVLTDPAHDIVRDVDVIYSTVNLWEGLQAGYNDGSVDWTSFVVPKITNQAELDNELNRLETVAALAKEVLPSGVVSETSFANITNYIKTCREQPALALENKFHLNQTIKGIYVGLHCYANYTYNFSDLKARPAIKDSRVMWPDVEKAEQEGFAVPLSVSNNYTQYLAQYNTDKAYFLGEEYLGMIFLNQTLKAMNDFFRGFGLAWRNAINKQARIKMQQKRTELEFLKGKVNKLESIEAINGFKKLSSKRADLGLPASRSATDDATVAYLRISNNEFFGVNSKYQSPKTEILLKVNAQTKTHAEAEVVQKAINAGMKGRVKSVEMWVDRDPCKACGVNNGIGSLARELGVEEIIVHSPLGTQKFYPPK